VRWRGFWNDLWNWPERKFYKRGGMTGCRQCEVLLRLLNDESLPAAITETLGMRAAAGAEELRQMIMSRVETELLREVVHERNAS